MFAYSSSSSSPGYGSASPAAWSSSANDLVLVRLVAVDHDRRSSSSSLSTLKQSPTSRSKTLVSSPRRPIEPMGAADAGTARRLDGCRAREQRSASDPRWPTAQRGEHDRRRRQYGRRARNDRCRTDASSTRDHAPSAPLAASTASRVRMASVLALAAPRPPRAGRSPSSASRPSWRDPEQRRPARRRSLGRVVLVALSVLGSQIVTGAMNDWADRDRDAVTQPSKPIPAGEATPIDGAGPRGRRPRTAGGRVRCRSGGSALVLGSAGGRDRPSPTTCGCRGRPPRSSPTW